MALTRVYFCGVIEGSVTLRPGELEADAIGRAEKAIQAVLDRGAKRYARQGDQGGPVIGLEPGE